MSAPLLWACRSREAQTKTRAVLPCDAIVCLFLGACWLVCLFTLAADERSAMFARAAHARGFSIDRKKRAHASLARRRRSELRILAREGMTDHKRTTNTLAPHRVDLFSDARACRSPPGANWNADGRWTEKTGSSIERATGFSRKSVDEDVRRCERSTDDHCFRAQELRAREASGPRVHIVRARVGSKVSSSEGEQARRGGGLIPRGSHSSARCNCVAANDDVPGERAGGRA